MTPEYYGTENTLTTLLIATIMTLLFMALGEWINYKRIKNSK